MSALVIGALGGQISSLSKLAQNKIPSALLPTVGQSTQTPTALTSGDLQTILNSCCNTVATTTSTTLAPVVTVTGKGVLELAAWGNASGSSTSELTITIDGVVVMSATNASAQTMRCAVGALATTAAYLTSFALGSVPFQTSLLIQHRSGTSGQTTVTGVRYRLHN